MGKFIVYAGAKLTTCQRIDAGIRSLRYLALSGKHQLPNVVPSKKANVEERHATAIVCCVISARRLFRKGIHPVGQQTGKMHLIWLEA